MTDATKQPGWRRWTILGVASAQDETTTAPNPSTTSAPTQPGPGAARRVPTATPRRAAIDW